MRKVLAFLTVLATPATALELTYVTSYDLNRPASLDYDPTFCGLWIANEGQRWFLSRCKVTNCAALAVT